MKRKFNNYLTAVESKAESVLQLKNLTDELSRELKNIDLSEDGIRNVELKIRIRKRYARIANRALSDLFFSPDDFHEDTQE